MNILLGTLAVAAFMGMLADKDARNRENFTWAFIAVIVAITALNIK